MSPNIIPSAIGKAVAQMSDRRFLRVLALGLGSTIALLAAFTMAVVWAIGVFIPDVISVPVIGQINWAQSAASWAAMGLMLLLSIFLMVPVASAVTGIFLDDVAQAVEDKHFPHLSPAKGLTLSENISESLRFLGVLIVANLAALVLYLIFLPFAPLSFWALNGYLLGHEYFQLVARRHMSRDQAKALRKQHFATVWAAGAVMAVPLSIPIVNLLIPVFGAASFTHIYHRVTQQ